MSEHLYQLFQPRGPFAASALLGCKSCQHPRAEPENPNVPSGEWYCTNPRCVVRECAIRCKLYGEPLPRMSCPACQAPLKFHHWIGHETLVPVSNAAARAESSAASSAASSNRVERRRTSQGPHRAAESETRDGLSG